MNRKLLLKIVFACVSLALVLLILYSGLQILESTVLYVEPEAQWETETKTVRRDGVSYYPRQDITVIMLLGINRRGVVEATAPNEGGAADMITLMIFDEQDQTYSLLSINRDTMLDMPALDKTGKIIGTYYGQAAFAHTYGTGMDDSCENVKKAVSAFLHGITVDYYAALNMDAIAILNDAVGGVTVTIEDDFTEIDPTMTMGEVTLTGEQAVDFVQARRNVGDKLNLSRIRRQQEYMDGFTRALYTKIEESDTFLLSAYEKIAPYIVTDCSVNVLSGLAERYSDYTLKENVTPAGENVVGEYMEYYVDEEELDELVLRLFYAPK